jgi:hypothetical protein
MSRTPSLRRSVAKTRSNTAISELSNRRAEEDSAALAHYIADMSAELSDLAGRSQMPMVAYFLSLARVEAEMRSREAGGVPIIRQK